jgi:putative pyruvate formate lyase activating enzyme
LAGLFLNLQKRGAHNINFVSPTPYLRHIVQALEIASKKDLRLPIVDNTSGYELLEVVKMLDGIVDVWLPDFKYHDPQLARRVSGAPGYREIAYDAIDEMFRQVGELRVDDEGIAVSGTIVRHLVLPGQVENSKQVLDIIAGSPFKSACLSLMSQYFPAYKAPGSQLSRRVTAGEYSEVRGYAEELGFEDGWFQDI